MLKIKLQEGQKLFFTSDTHYNHKNICRGVSNWEGGLDKTRDFKTLSQMNDAIVNGINEVVGQDDILIHLGDWSFGGFEYVREFRNRVLCRDIHLILGNHDHHIENDREGCQELFTSVSHYTRLEVTRPSHPIISGANYTKQTFVLSHFPICSWHDMSKGNIHLFGHVHLPATQKIMPGRSIDVGMDGSYMKPYSLTEINILLKHQPIKTNIIELDHHETESR
jgi:calcineurin-like phosphoesterase family protein